MLSSKKAIFHMISASEACSDFEFLADDLTVIKSGLLLFIPTTLIDSRINYVNYRAVIFRINKSIILRHIVNF